MKFKVYKEYTKHLLIEHKEKEPSLFQILLHRDDFTPMEFIMTVLERFFYMDRSKAAVVMLEARVQGKAICGMFGKDFAEAKVSQVVDYAKAHEHPLICSMEAAV